MIRAFKTDSGFTLLETIIALGVFVIVSLSIYFTYANILKIVADSSFSLATLTVIQNEIESVRNMAYDDIGITGGSPPGKLTAQKTVILDGIPFIVKTTVRSVDDPFDGTLGGSPNDLSPADYKVVEVEANCDNCGRLASARMTTSVAPKQLEAATQNGALFINVIDASGQPVSGANVSVTNNLVMPNITVQDVTNTAGSLQLIGIPASSFGYNVSVTKAGYSSERTYQPGAPSNPNPLNPYATVVKQQVTSLSLAIDKLSTFQLSTSDMFCSPVGNFDFIQNGSKLIGTSPNILKYSATLATNTSGVYVNNGLEWDTYGFQGLDTANEIGGTFSAMPIAINPDSTTYLKWLVEPKLPLSVLATVRDQSGQLINDAKVTLSKPSFSQSLMTGRRPAIFSDWSGGRYAEKSEYLATDSPAGQLVLSQINGKYATSSWEWLISRTIDLGTNNTTLIDLNWSPVSQPPQAGSPSVRFQLAANNDNATWNFVGPDGTAGSYYTTSGALINQSHNNNRYLRYKVFLFTESEQFSPTIDDVSINLRSGCIPEGQAFFSGLSAATYTLTIEKTGYQTYTNPDFSITKSWQETKITLIP